MVVELAAENAEGGHIYLAPAAYTVVLSLKGIKFHTAIFITYLIKTSHVDVELCAITFNIHDYSLG